MSLSLRVTPVVSCALALVGCSDPPQKVLPPLGQVLLYVDTDAPLPPPPGTTRHPDEPAPLFDRMRIDVFPPGARKPCASCSREFGLDREQVEQHHNSFAVTPTPGRTGYVARLRLFRRSAVRTGEPPPVSTIDSYVALPRVEQEGRVEVTARLLVDDLGTTQGSLESPVEPEPGKLPSLVGSWPAAARVPCRGKPRAGEACVPGGAFWMGNPLLGVAEDGSDASLTRLVTLSPFFVDLHETTVADFRATGLATLDEQGAHAQDPLEGARANRTLAQEGKVPLTPSDKPYYCDYAATVDADETEPEALALNCVTWQTARQYCVARGADLPTSAQYEYIAGALESKTYVWGNEGSGLRCADVSLDRSGVGYFYDGSRGTCRPQGEAGGPQPPGSGRLDRLALGEREVVDLAGNVSEWMLDDWNRPSEPCWSGHALMHDPLCMGLGADGDLRTTMGGSWITLPVPAASAFGRDPHQPVPWIGFRCARPGD